MACCLSVDPKERFDGGDWQLAREHPVFDPSRPQSSSPSSKRQQLPPAIVATALQEEEAGLLEDDGDMDGEGAMLQHIWLRQWYPEASIYSEEIADQLLGL